ncbi:MAG: DNA repair protein RadC [Muribaculaceae bacterium]|nr:DNA repair protein RadC [Muribaculaceae bacterium]
MNSPDARLIADLPEQERPREKALRLGMKALSDTELMAIVFGTGIRGKGVVALCDEILGAHGRHLSEIARMGAREFIKSPKGIGPAKALTLLAGIELGVRAAADAVSAERKAMTDSRAAYEYMNRHLYNLDHEEFWALYLDNSLHVAGERRIGQGGLTMTAVDPKIVLREALVLNSAAIMLFHNHPSGQLKASTQDVALTKKICEAARLLDMRVLDHIIIGHSDYLSMHDEGLM